MPVVGSCNQSGNWLIGNCSLCNVRETLCEDSPFEGTFLSPVFLRPVYFIILAKCFVCSFSLIDSFVMCFFCILILVFGVAVCFRLRPSCAPHGPWERLGRNSFSAVSDSTGVLNSFLRSGIRGLSASSLDSRLLIAFEVWSSCWKNTNYRVVLRIVKEAVVRLRNREM